MSPRTDARVLVLVVLEHLVPQVLAVKVAALETVYEEALTPLKDFII